VCFELMCNKHALRLDLVLKSVSLLIQPSLQVTGLRG
jgi:hypothetical protein